MKVLYISTSFPEPNKGATIYTDLAEALHKAGHEITVAVSEEAKHKDITEMKQERGFDVLRVVTGNYYDVGLVEKGVTTLKIPVLMRKGISKYLGHRRFDLILCEAPPVTNAGLVAWAKKRFNCSAYLMQKDIFPQNAADLGIIKPNSLLYKYFEAKEKQLYKTADIIGCMSPANRNFVLERNPWLDSGKLELFPNTKKIADYTMTHEFSMRKKYGIPKGVCVFLFGGNMGRPQYIELLCKAVESCKEDARVFFLFIGRGTDRYKLEQTIKHHAIKNALVINSLPRDEYERIAKECDVGLIVLDPRFTIPNYPSRILSYMEFAKPILAATDRVSDLKDLISEAQCGEWVWSGDISAFVYKIKEMAMDSATLIDKGKNGRIFLESEFNVKRSVKILESHFN